MIVEELNGDLILAPPLRRLYYARGFAQWARSRGRATRWRVRLREAGLDAMAAAGGSPLRLYTSSVLASVARKHARDGTIVCDVGAGRGGNARAIPAASRYLAIDVLPGQGVATSAGRWYVQASALAAPVRSASVDFVLTASSLEHMPEPRTVARELARIMRPGAVALHLLPAHASLVLYGLHGYRRFSPDEARELLSGGLEVIDLFLLGGPASFLLHLVWIGLLETSATLEALSFGVIRWRGLGARMRRGRLLPMYATLLRWALTADARLPALGALGYALVLRKAT